MTAYNKLHKKQFLTEKKEIKMRYWRIIFLWVTIIICALMILYLVFQSQYIRPLQDDFYYYPPSNWQDVVNLLHERFTWTGRFSTTTVHIVTGWLKAYWVVPFISFSVMITGIYTLSKVLMTKFFEIERRHNKEVSLLLATGLTLGIFLITPSPYSSIFWLSGAPIHFWSYGFILLYCAYILKRILDHTYRFRLFEYILTLVIPLIIGMMGEVAMFTLVAFMGLILFFACLYKSEKLALIVIPNFLGLTIAFFELFFSTGAVIRRGSEGGVAFSEVISQAPHIIISNFYVLLTSLMSNKVIFIVMFFMALILGAHFMRPIANTRKTALFTLIVTMMAMTLMSLNFIGVYSSVRLDIAWSRTQAFSVIIIVGLVMLYGVVIGSLVEGWVVKQYSLAMVRRVTSGIIVMSTVMIISHAAFLPYIHQFSTMIQDRAVAYDKRGIYITTSIKTDKNMNCPILLPITYLPGTQEGFDLTPEEDHALNVGVQRYYHLPCGVIGR